VLTVYPAEHSVGTIVGTKMKQAIAILLTTALFTWASPSPALAHGTSKIVHHRIQRVNGAVRAYGTFKVSEPHQRLSVTVFIIQGSRIIGEKTRRARGRSVRVQLRVDCVREAPVYAVVQGDINQGGHFTAWNSRTIVCRR